METFSALLAICAGNSPVPGEFPTQRPVTRSFDVFFDLRLNKRLSKHREAGDVSHYRAHYDVTVMNADHGDSLSLLLYSTPKQLEMQWCMPSTVSTDVLVPKHQAISIYNVDKVYIFNGHLKSPEKQNAKINITVISQPTTI